MTLNYDCDESVEAKCVVQREESYHRYCSLRITAGRARITY